jgi:hypothetical protein
MNNSSVERLRRTESVVEPEFICQSSDLHIRSSLSLDGTNVLAVSTAAGTSLGGAFLLSRALEDLMEDNYCRPFSAWRDR